MILTEEEARTKWCPMVRASAVAYVDGGTDDFDNRGKTTLTPKSACCIASECMMWQWANDENDEPLYDKKSLGGGHFDNAPMGYCGLTSK